MKKLALAALLVSSVSFAGEVCGNLDSVVVGPHCVIGTACPMYLRLQYVLNTENGKRYDLNTGDHSVMENFGEFKGRQVCVEGTESADTIEVSSIILK